MRWARGPSPDPHPEFEPVRRVARNPYAWPGGYPVALIMYDGELMCARCVRGNYRLILEATRDGSVETWNGPYDKEWTAAGFMILEGTAEDYGDTRCANCGRDILEAESEPAYTYEREDADTFKAGPIGNRSILTRDELLDRLENWIRDPETTIEALEADAGEWHRSTPFAYYRAMKK